MADEKAKSADEKKLERARAAASRLNEVVAAAKVLCAGWQATGFYDRQDPVYAVNLHDALDAYETGDKT